MKNFKLTSLVKKFLIKHDCEQGRFLLALSGGCDSLSLFYILLEIFAGRSAPFHVAHIDHGWRDSSAQEAVQLKQLCHKYDLTFHVQTLSPSDAIGNLENHCRNQRLKFFKQVCRQFKLIGVFLGHHQNDQAETILKRVLEGAHWSNLAGISEKSEIGQLKLFRPLLKVSKQQLEDYLAEIKIEPIQDFSNFDSKFLRARMRQKIIPSLEKEFGKNIEKSLVKLANSFQNINRDYDEEVAIYLKKIEQGPFGFYLDFNQLPGLSRSLLDYLLHKISERHAVALSYSQIDLVATFLQKGFANKIFFSLKKVFSNFHINETL